MSVYVDEPFRYPLPLEGQARRVAIRHDGKWCHLWCDPEDLGSLRDIARKIGMRRQWFQNRPGFPHYDIVPGRRRIAIEAGAVPTKLSDWIKQRP